MLLETWVREIGVRFVFNERQNHDSNSPINPNLNEEVTMMLFVRSMSKTSTIAHNWVEQVKDFSSDIYNRAGEDKQLKEGLNSAFSLRWFWSTWPIKPHPQSSVVGLLLHLHWGDNFDWVGRLRRRQERGQCNNLFGLTTRGKIAEGERAFTNCDWE